FTRRARQGDPGRFQQQPSNLDRSAGRRDAERLASLSCRKGALGPSTRWGRRRAVDRPFDMIVVGLGAMGSATTCQLARRGYRVLGLDMFELGHQQGSSHGYHRLIRRATVESPGYVTLSNRT